MFAPWALRRSLVRIAGGFVARFHRLRFRQALLAQKDAEHRLDRDRQIFRLQGLQGRRPEFRRSQKWRGGDRLLARERAFPTLHRGAPEDMQRKSKHEYQHKRQER
jgi:hypothetical protein